VRTSRALVFIPGFGLTVTLPELIGKKTPLALLFLDGTTHQGDEAHRIGLATCWCRKIKCAALAVSLARRLRAARLWASLPRERRSAGLADRVSEATDRELTEQSRLRKNRRISRKELRASGERRDRSSRGASLDSSTRERVVIFEVFSDSSCRATLIG